MRYGCGYHTYTGGSLVLPTPTTPDPDEGFVPPPPGPQGEELRVAIGPFPGFGPLKVLWDARIENNQERLREMGGNTVTISVPASPTNMRLLGDRIPSTRLHHAKNAIARELVVGSTVDGKARHRFVIRDEWVQVGDRVEISGVGFTGGLDGDVVIGAPTRLNLIGDAVGAFSNGDLRGWRKVGDVETRVVKGGPVGKYKAQLRGTPDGSSYIEATAPYSQPQRPWGRQRIGGQVYVELPGYGLDIEDYGLVSIVVTDAVTGAEYWPGSSDDLEAGIVTAEMRRGAFTQDPVEAIGYLPLTPYRVNVRIRLYPVDETQWVGYTGGAIIRRENTSTVNPVDRVNHIEQLWRHANLGRDKSQKGVIVSLGVPTKDYEIGTWWHEDATPLPEAIEGVCAQGLEVWDLPSGRREVRASKRRGKIRSDLQVNPWDVLGIVTWKVDPGAQRTAVRATSSSGSMWGGADVGAIDPSQAGGQIIDVVLAGPSGMTPSQLRAWANERLASLRLIQATSTVFVPWALGKRIAVGDTVRFALQAGSAGHVDWMRVHAKTPDVDGRRFWALDVGTDPTNGGY